MHIAVLGSGNMGSALGRLFAGAGHAVTFSYSRDASKLERLAEQCGPRCRAASVGSAVRDAEVLLLAVHWSRVDDVLRDAGDIRSRILIDCTNPMNDSDDALIEGLTVSGGEIVARRVPGTPVVKAFNTVPSELLSAGPGVLSERAAVCYCGDDAVAKETVGQLIRDIGFEPVDCGALSMARYLEPLALLVAGLAYDGVGRPELGLRFIRPDSP